MAEETKSKSKVPPPGPGNYELPSFPNDHPASHVSVSSKFSMGKGRPEPSARKDAADPGKYHPNVQAVQPRSAAWGFGSAKRMLSEPSKSQATPGANLGQIDNPMYFRSPRYGFGSTERMGNPIPGTNATEDKKNKRPGPGAHNPDINVTSKMRSVPSYTAAPRRENTVNLKLPGPGSYTATDASNQTWKASPRYKFGSAARQIVEKASTPGPGQYTVANLTKTGHNSVGDSAPKWSMTARPSFLIAKDTC
eukprot:gnl/MRDRNA2_/MRDRNA2_112377_c0_seq1.p1 gnl/MRDRNA2_/MRDRNA2_112377_c0~~gnl/MRDRNA2_/MRDRNA2_112377_c0_seq1.p1  ORF type:complete len:275 (+),score=47.17 gnl/MRDRNA2_/MRDRNA2_112377_c0_seq1:75-827(+)